MNNNCQVCLFANSCKENKENCTVFKVAPNGGNLWKFHTVPFEHQKRCLNHMLVNSNAALLLEMGTGKTKIMLDWLVNYASVRPVLILCPKSVIGVWLAEIRKHAPSLLTGTGILEDRSDIGKYQISIANYEKVRLWVTTLKSIGYQCIICDESSKIKNFKAVVTKRVCYIGKRVPYKFILTGTPITNKEFDLWSQFYFLDEGKSLGESMYHFREKYFEADAFGFTWSIKPGAHDMICSLIKPKSFLIKKAECVDLPEQTYSRVDVPMTEEQHIVYNDMKTKFEVVFDRYQKIDTKWVLAQLIYLQEIANGYIYNATTETHIKIKNAKLDALRDVLDTLTTNKTVIWTRFKANMIDIVQLIKDMDRDVQILTSDMSAEERARVIEHCAKCPHPTILITNPQIGGYGIDMTWANYAIYYSNSFNYSDRIQSEARLHRVGQKSKVTYIDLVTKGTIDEKIVDALQRKEDLLQFVLKSIQRK